MSRPAVPDILSTTATRLIRLECCFVPIAFYPCRALYQKQRRRRKYALLDKQFNSCFINRDLPLTAKDGLW